MSGPVRTEDAPVLDEPVPAIPGRVLEITPSRTAQVGAHVVRRALPRRARRTVGAWCFIDHMGPATATGATDEGIGPHPHIGLQTVTWLLAGELLHRDTIGSEQAIRPGQLNLMTAGHGVAHAEEQTGYRGRFHGVQLWMAQPERTRHDPAAFEHHAELPQADLANGVATVLVGTLAGVLSPARRDTDNLGADLALRSGASVLPLEPRSEHALVVLDGAVIVEGERIDPGNLAYLGTERDELAVDAPDDARVLLVGGEPFESPVLMWWNFVARDRTEIDAASDAWNAADERFGAVATQLAVIPAPPRPWAHS